MVLSLSLRGHSAGPPQTGAPHAYKDFSTAEWQATIPDLSLAADTPDRARSRPGQPRRARGRPRRQSGTPRFGTRSPFSGGRVGFAGLGLSGNHHGRLHSRAYNPARALARGGKRRVRRSLGAGAQTGRAGVQRVAHLHRSGPRHGPFCGAPESEDLTLYWLGKTIGLRPSASVQRSP